MAMISTCFCTTVIVKFVQTGFSTEFSDAYSVLLCVFSGDNCIFAGVLLATISQKNRQDFEMVLQQCDREYKKLTK